jgi:outer membrane protein TolC
LKIKPFRKIIPNHALKQFFTDPNLVNLIDEALKNNQELMITLQQIEIAKSDVMYKNGKLSPTVAARLGAGIEKVGRYTSTGAGDASTIQKEVPETWKFRRWFGCQLGN